MQSQRDTQQLFPVFIAKSFTLCKSISNPEILAYLHWPTDSPELYLYYPPTHQPCTEPLS